jgi:AcrR family transcriptional regulator
MSPKRKLDPEARRGELEAAAMQVFMHKGVARTAVSDIVKAAGVAQGTFYLYFESKTHIINAVVDRMVDGMVDAIEQAVRATDSGAVDRLLAFRDTLLSAVEDPATRELTEIYHRPENRAVHDRMAQRIAPRLVPIMEGIVRDGVREGVFTVDDPRTAALFVLGGFQVMEHGFSHPEEMGQAMSVATRCALRALGHGGTP